MIHWASRRSAVIWAFAVALILAGGVSFTRLPLATKTRIELPQLSIQTFWPGASAELIEAYITSPIEAAIQPVRGVRKTSSESGESSRFGGQSMAGSRIRVDLDPGVDVGLTRLAILERLELLRPERMGVELSEELQLHPEQSTDAFVFHHPEAKYFSV